ncbi:MAG: stage II sporulation protein M [Clostridiaceae bacterium]|nr:stage II sporulation protein M [Clostridiaceae bacterium]
MKEERFIEINSNLWKELENLYSFINKKGLKALSSMQVKQFLHIFRQCSHHLAYARTHYANSSVVIYLNSLIGKCHSHVYAVKKISQGDFVRYLAYEFPKLLKEYKWYVLASFGFFVIGFVVSLLLVLLDTNTASMFLPQNLIAGVKSGQSGGGQWNYPLMSSTIMVNNITVSLKAFALGITLGIGTIYVLFFNGTMLGSLTALIYLYGKPLNFWSLILPHGLIELTAIFISGASGLIIARYILLPGEYTRKSALIAGAKKAVSLIMGVVFMLIIAAIIEGFFTPLNIFPEVKLFFAAITGIILIVYFSIPYIVKR